MDKNALSRAFMPLLIIFLVVSAISLSFQERLIAFKIDPTVLIVANLIIFAVVALSFYFYAKSLKSNRPAVFMKYIYGAMFMKMMVCAIVAVGYILANGKNVNKGAIFGGIFLYFLYTFVEVAAVMKLSKQNKNA